MRRMEGGENSRGYLCKPKIEKKTQIDDINNARRSETKYLNIFCIKLKTRILNIFIQNLIFTTFKGEMSNLKH